MLHIWIGYDERFKEPYDVCRFSIERRASQPVVIHPLKHRALRERKLFTRPWHIAENGQYIDVRDGLPFSTEFSHTRFLTPHLAKLEGVDWALFVDCDFLFLEDIAELFDQANPEKALQCVQHQYEPPEGVKMDGMQQTRYRRKNWSSLMLFNVKAMANQMLTPFAVNYHPGSWLHSLGWLDHFQIGALDPSWNVLVGTPPPSTVRAVHYTEGGPWLPGFEDVDFAADWREEYRVSQEQ